MFTWICPKCGTEVPPSYADCPNCVKVATPTPPPPAAPARLVFEPQAPAYSAPTPIAYPAPAPLSAVVPVPVDQLPPPPPPTFGMTLPDRSYGERSPGGGLPSWLVALLSLAAVAALGAGVVYFLRENKATATEAALADKNEPIQQATQAHPLAKFVEITGLRLWQERQKLALKFLVVNHSSGPLGGFDLEVEVKAVNAKPTDPPLFTIKTPIKNIGPMESRDFTVPVASKLHAYDLPDWQFLRATFRIANAD